MKVIWHFYANQVNMGDWASALGVRQFLSRSVCEDLTFVDRFLSKELTDAELDELNENAHLVVVGGGGLWFRKDFPLGWYWNITPQQLGAIRCPIVLYSIGLNDVEYGRSKRWSLDQRALNGISKVLEKAALVGVRDYWTLGWLNELRVGSAHLVPCPSMFLGEGSGSESIQESVIGINITPLSRIRHSHAFLGTMGRLIESLIAKGFQIRYLCHSSSPDDGILRLYERFPGELVVPRNPYELLKAYASPRMIIGMRAHSILFSFSQDRPVFAITYSRKCEAFVELLGMQRYSMKWPTFWIWGISPSLVREIEMKICGLMERSSEVHRCWQEYRALYRRYNEEFADRVACLL